MIKFVDNSVEIKAQMDDIITNWLEEAAGELEAQTKRNTPVDTGQLKASWSHTVDGENQKAVVGSNIENAIWNEFGTGEFALNGNGRKTPWRYEDVHGKWHTTSGKKPKRSLFNAFTKSKAKIQKNLNEKLKGLGK